MSDEWRELLYYLGFLSSAAFGLRMAVQWLYSEYVGRSVVMRTFWQLSLCGNILLGLHAFIQMQYHIFVAQVANGVISWRNLNLMDPAHKPLTTRQTVAIMVAALSLGTLAYTAQADTWFRVPVLPWSAQKAFSVSWMWHAIGIVGLVMFNSRFWIQWWGAEKKQQSTLGATFWWISLTGEMLCLTYFMRINDTVNYIGPLFAMVPYIRNLMLIYKGKQQPVRE